MMKKLLYMALLITTSVTYAQNVDMRRKIEVTGSAETEVTPDIIYFTVSLKEFMDGKNKVDIDQLESQLQKAVTLAGIAKEDFTVNNISGYITYQKKKDPNFLAGKQYRLKLHDLNKVSQLLGGVNSKGIESTNIESYDYSKISELKNTLKLKAVISAKEKATYLLAGIGEKIGGAIEITEVDDNNLPQMRPVQYMARASENAVPDNENIDFKKIKLNFQVRAVFEIVK